MLPSGAAVSVGLAVLCRCANSQVHGAQVAWPFVWFLPPIMWLNNIFRPAKGAAVFIPSSLLRYLTFKLTVDLQPIPALQVLF